MTLPTHSPVTSRHSKSRSFKHVRKLRLRLEVGVEVVPADEICQFGVCKHVGQTCLNKKPLHQLKQRVLPLKNDGTGGL